MKIFIDINNKKIESENKSEPNFYLLKFKDIEVKDEFQEFNLIVVNNIEVKLDMKVKNKFNSEKVENLFQKFQPIQNKKEEAAQRKSVIGTGVNMKERLAMFSNNKKDNNTNNRNSTTKKLKILDNLNGIDSKVKPNDENNKKIVNEKEKEKEIKKEEEKINKEENSENKDVNDKSKEEKINKEENNENKGINNENKEQQNKIGEIKEENEENYNEN